MDGATLASIPSTSTSPSTNGRRLQRRSSCSTSFFSDGGSGGTGTVGGEEASVATAVILIADVVATAFGAILSIAYYVVCSSSFEVSQDRDLSVAGLPELFMGSLLDCCVAKMVAAVAGFVHSVAVLRFLFVCCLLSVAFLLFMMHACFLLSGSKERVDLLSGL